MKILTVIEEPPTGNAYDSTIDDFIKWFDGKSFPGIDMEIKRASDMRSLRDALRPGNPPTTPISQRNDPNYNIIQIIGHGRAGQLSVGETWTGVPSSDKAVYRLDANHSRYGLLNHTVVSASKVPVPKVYLVGCFVGDSTQPQIYGANGDTLLIDLAQMWGCEVIAATELLSAEQSMDPTTGLYIGPRVSWTWENSPRRTLRGQTNALPPPKPIGSAHVEFVQLIQVPELGPLSTLPISIPPESAHTLELAFDKTVNWRRVLAAPELIFEVMWEGTLVQANLICNRRYLEVLAPSGQVLATVRAAPNQLNHVGAAIKLLLEYATAV